MHQSLPLILLHRGLIADLIGADLDEVVFVPNTSHGMNTILRNIEWREGDIILESTSTRCACVPRYA